MRLLRQWLSARFVGITRDEVIDGARTIFEISAEEHAIGMRCLEGKPPAQQNEIKLTLQECADF